MVTDHALKLILSRSPMRHNFALVVIAKPRCQLANLSNFVLKLEPVVRQRHMRAARKQTSQTAAKSPTQTLPPALRRAAAAAGG